MTHSNKPLPHYWYLITAIYLVQALAGCTSTIQTPPAVPSDQSTIHEIGRWVLVDTRTRALSVYEGENWIARFEPIAIGSGGAAKKRRQGDMITPLGRFRVGWISRTSKFHLFFGLTYPSAEYAEGAKAEGRITNSTYLAIARAEDRGETPPQNTVLGGMIGIHGVGRGSEELHHLINWTDGCIALTNSQIDQLGELISVGSVVHIR